MENNTTAAAAIMDPTAARVQHVPKASSDELLSKFAQAGSDHHSNPTFKKLDFRLSKRQKRLTHLPASESAEGGAERNSLLPPRRSSALIRQLRVGRARFRTRNFRNKSLFGTIEKTWRRTVEGASKVFMERHYDQHKRLISDIA